LSTISTPFFCIGPVAGSHKTETLLSCGIDSFSNSNYFALLPPEQTRTVDGPPCNSPSAASRPAWAIRAIAIATSCRHWSAGPVDAFTLWPPPAEAEAIASGGRLAVATSSAAMRAQSVAGEPGEVVLVRSRADRGVSVGHRDEIALPLGGHFIARGRAFSIEDQPTDQALSIGVLPGRPR
jgi:hypothetical protein